jgi:lysozyme
MTDWINNLKGVAKSTNLSGSYHYYRPNENSLEQATLLLKRFLKKGDLPPVLDIERLPETSLWTV